MAEKVFPGMFKQPKNDDAMGSFILNELRDLRRGMEGRDGELRGEMAALRDSISSLSESVQHSHSRVAGIRDDLDTMNGQVVELRKDVDKIKINHVSTRSQWDGPKKLAGIVVLAGSVAAAIAAIAQYWPTIAPAAGG